MKLCSVLLFFIAVGSVHAADPYVAFSDLANGPSSGIDDEIGEGAIVTLWGANLGTDSSGSNKVVVTDSAGDERDAVVYYWKNADGQLPSGPVNLYKSHGFQEIAFSIPQSSLGSAKIEVVVNGQRSNSIPFLVRAGNIYHVANTGNDSGGDGSWSNPWKTVKHAVNNGGIEPGSLLYSRGSIDGSAGSTDALRVSHSNISSSAENQFGILAYPNTQPKVIGRRGFYFYNTVGLVVSKFSVFSSSHAEVGNGQLGSEIGNQQTFGVATTDHGRIVGNYLSEIEGRCSSKFQGAIVGGSNIAAAGTGVSGVKILGNEIADYGCAGSSALHHTTYLTIRSESDPNVDAWEWGWNYLHNNEATLGIHNWDKDSGAGGTCGNIKGVVKIHDNVITQQGGAGISVGGSCGWGNDWHIYNNVLLDVGRAAAWDGSDPSSATNVQNNGIILTDGMPGSSFFIYHNLIKGWNGDLITGRRQACLYNDVSGSVSFINNICIDDYGMDFYASDGATFQGNGNIWFSNSNSNLPSEFNGSIIESDPKVEISGIRVRLTEGSPAIDGASTVQTSYSTRDVYGVYRGANGRDIGPVEWGAVSRPKPPILVE